MIIFRETRCVFHPEGPVVEAALKKMGLGGRSEEDQHPTPSGTNTSAWPPYPLVPLGWPGFIPVLSRLFRMSQLGMSSSPALSRIPSSPLASKHLAAMGSNVSLSLKQISQKLAVLMALVKVSKTSELRALDIRFRVYRPNGVVFKLASLTKKRMPGLPSKELFFWVHSIVTNVCVLWNA